MEQQLKLYAWMEAMQYCEKALLLGYGSEHTNVSTIYYHADYVTKALDYKAKNTRNLKSDSVLLCKAVLTVCIFDTYFFICKVSRGIALYFYICTELT